MKILVVADIVTPELTEGILGTVSSEVDLIISCGDLPPEYLSSLTHYFGVPLYYVKGNHDIRYQDSPPQGCQHIHRQVVTFQGVRFLGLSGSRWYNGGMNQYHEKEMSRFIRKLWLTLFWSCYAAAKIGRRLGHYPHAAPFATARFQYLAKSKTH